jgi:hypothetical protein
MSKSHYNLSNMEQGTALKSTATTIPKKHSISLSLPNSEKMEFHLTQAQADMINK